MRIASGASAVLLRATLGAAVAALCGTTVASAQQRDTTVANPDTPARMDAVIVTATRTEKSVFDVPKPVSVLDQADLRLKNANSAADLFRDLPGLDVVGVGPTQTRPSVRGQRGQRILLLQDGMRLNNSRRQQSFGEIPALVDVNALERVEIVRGPASVLYGTDAIGGAINLITRTPQRDGLHGGGGYRFSSHDEQLRLTGNLRGRYGRVSFMAQGTFRDADAYQAPAGTFGDITLGADTTVFDTGIRDHSIAGYLGYALSRDHEAFARVEAYRADTAGFGWVDPAAYAPGQPFIQIQYPFQRFDKVTVGYRGRNLGFALADRVDFVGYAQRNERELTNDVFVAFGPPGAGVSVESQNYTDLTTVGLRAEATKFAFDRVLFTYGVDLFRDESENTDYSEQTIVGFGPPQTTVNDVPLVPNATFRSAGAFLQADVQLLSRLSVILGGRFQDIEAATKPTEGITGSPTTETDRTVVGTANVIYRLFDNLSLVTSVGRAFRSPNLVERFFFGITPEGAAYQVPNPDLAPETSVNLDFGVRYRDDLVSVEAFVFRNEIRNGIRISPTDDSLNGLPTFSNVNVDKLRFIGVEATGDLFLPYGFRIGGSYSYLDTKDVLNENNPIGDTFSSKLLANLEYRDPSSTLYLRYDLRHNGERKDVVLGGPLGDPPVGSVLPAFTTHDVRGGVTFSQGGGLQHRVSLGITNLTDVLYAEFANASFFRPEPGRSLTLSYDIAF
ncbi:MAG: TonB-dependent receptor [Gemmatimonadales bacterium]|jgi:outer membrane receptor protein involved in Fe transport